MYDARHVQRHNGSMQSKCAMNMLGIWKCSFIINEKRPTRLCTEMVIERASAASYVGEIVVKTMFFWGATNSIMNESFRFGLGWVSLHWICLKILVSVRKHRHTTVCLNTETFLLDTWHVSSTGFILEHDQLRFLKIALETRMRRWFEKTFGH